jgi:hypothetical protein
MSYEPQKPQWDPKDTKTGKETPKKTQDVEKKFHKENMPGKSMPGKDLPEKGA